MRELIHEHVADLAGTHCLKGSLICLAIALKQILVGVHEEYLIAVLGLYTESCGEGCDQRLAASTWHGDHDAALVTQLIRG